MVHVISVAPLSVGYLERTPQELLPFQMAVEGISIHEVKRERLLENQEVNVTYWYHSRWKDTKSRVESFNEEENGNNCSLIKK